jgi:hypothetical protein
LTESVLEGVALVFVEEEADSLLVEVADESAFDESLFAALLYPSLR